MLNRKYVAFGGAFALLAGAVIVHACGPFFPLQLLDNRAGTLSGTPNNSFAYEVARLVTPGDHVLAPEAVPVAAGAQAVDPAKAVLSGLTPAQIATLTAMAKAADGDTAYALGAGVPDAQRLYAAADVDYTHALTGCASTAVASAASGSSASDADEAAANPAASSAAASGTNAANQTALASSNASSSTAAAPSACASKEVLLARAATRLEAILALPAPSGAPRSVAAATELAAIAQARADSCTDADACKTLTAALPAAYARPRALAANGAPDPQGLAVASFGDEALTYLYDPKSDKQCDYRSFLNDTPCAAAITPANLKRAIGLYAQQAARGGVSGVESLQFIATWVLAGKTRVASLIDDPVAQRLLVAYALAREGDIVNDQPASASEYYGGYDNSFGPTGYADAARGDKGIKPNPALVSLVEAIRQRGIDHVAGADRLAALAYRVGRYDFAGMLAAREHSALASWVSAKLALRRGDTAAAVQAYAQASKGFPAADSSVEPAGARLIKGEQAVLTLSRGQYVEALGYLFDAASRRNDASVNEDSVTDIGYGSDMAYIAERVLTTDELKHFVDTRVPTWSAAPPLPTDPNAYYAARPSAGDSLRYLLARRLVRDGRIDEAQPYFPADDDPRYSSYDWKNGQTVRTQLHLRELAHDYGAALDQAQHAWTRTNRARGWFDAATLAKQFGMELMGYEQGPDYHDIDGDFEGGSGRSGVIGAHVARVSGANAASDAVASPAKQPDTPATRAENDLAGPFVTADEKRRYAASESRPLMRFHYREIAAGYIAKAADALPARSQAFAAVLCRGTDWMHNYDPERAQGFYKRYVKEGAYVDFGGGSFGALCAEPDFKAAATFTYTQAWRDARRDVGRHKKRAALIGVLVLAGVMGAGWWWYRRRTTGSDRPTP